MINIFKIQDLLSDWIKFYQLSSFIYSKFSELIFSKLVKIYNKLSQNSDIFFN